MPDAPLSSKMPPETPIQEITDFPFVILSSWEVEESPRFATRALAKKYLEEQGSYSRCYIAKVTSRVKGIKPPVTVEEEDI
jgi:hypothetical protein